jgi:hypothetical protein
MGSRCSKNTKSFFSGRSPNPQKARVKRRRNEMLQAEQARNGHAHIPISLTVLEGEHPRPRTKPANHNFSAAERMLTPCEVNLSGAQVLLGSAAVLGSIVSFLWILVKLWLFGQ